MRYVIETWLLYITMVKHHLGPPLPENLKPHRNTSKHMGTTHSQNFFLETVLQEVKYEVQAMGARWASVQIKGLHYFRVFWKLG